MEKQTLELEAFRQEWQAEVLAKFLANHSPLKTEASRQVSVISHPINTPSKNTLKNIEKENHENDVLSLLESAGIIKEHVQAEGSSVNCEDKQPLTAQDYYELAIEKEDQSNLRDSLSLYRKAFRMDHRVDQKYRSKHFPSAHLNKEVQITHSLSSLDATTLSNSDYDSMYRALPNFRQLIESFSSLSIQPRTSSDEGIYLSCPFAKLPSEILIHIMTILGTLDVASLAKVVQVCKRIAYLVVTEEQIWKHVCLGSEAGFGGMHYEWQRNFIGGQLSDQDLTNKSSDEQSNFLNRDVLSEVLLHKAYSSSWYQMFRLRPRIRFNGCYISTINYTRPGEASPSQVSWNSPILVVTYYRYLRFFRDGTLISLITTNEPLEVVQYLTKRFVEIHRNGAVSHLPSKVMQRALLGRWHLTKYSGNPDLYVYNDESDVYIETEGANVKYLYQVKLSLRSSGRGCKNNKLAWRKFCSFNRVTNETEEFHLNAEKAFYWSRVKSYSKGE